MLTAATAAGSRGVSAHMSASSGTCLCSTLLGDEVLLDLGSRRALLKSLQAQDQEVELNLLGYLVGLGVGTEYTSIRCMMGQK